MSSCATGAALGFIPIATTHITDKVTQMALPIINKIPEPTRKPAELLLNLTVRIGTICGFAYLSSIPAATMVTMMTVYAIYSTVIKDQPDNIEPPGDDSDSRPSSTILSSDEEEAGADTDASANSKEMQKALEEAMAALAQCENSAQTTSDLLKREEDK